MVALFLSPREKSDSILLFNSSVFLDAFVSIVSIQLNDVACFDESEDDEEEEDEDEEHDSQSLGPDPDAY